MRLYPAILLGLNTPTQTYRLEIGGVAYQVSVAVLETIPRSVPSEQSNNEEDETKRKWNLTRRREGAKNRRNCRRECRVLLSGIKPCRSFSLQLPDSILPSPTETRTYTHDPPGCGVFYFTRKKCYPGYIEKAQRTGASYFNLGDAWNTLTPAQRTAANRHFLDVVADAGDQVYFSVPKMEIRRGSALADEVQYLTGERGYQWINQWSLRPYGD